MKKRLAMAPLIIFGNAAVFAIGAVTELFIGTPLLGILAFTALVALSVIAVRLFRKKSGVGYGLIFLFGALPALLISFAYAYFVRGGETALPFVLLWYCLLFGGAV